MRSPDIQVVSPLTVSDDRRPRLRDRRDPPHRRARRGRSVALLLRTSSAARLMGVRRMAALRCARANISVATRRARHPSQTRRCSSTYARSGSASVLAAYASSSASGMWSANESRISNYRQMSAVCLRSTGLVRRGVRGVKGPPHALRAAVARRRARLREQDSRAVKSKAGNAQSRAWLPTDCPRQ
jgi:hypothetical protein